MVLKFRKLEEVFDDKLGDGAWVRERREQGKHYMYVEILDGQYNDRGEHTG